MGFKSRVNHIRRTFFKKLTENIGKKSIEEMQQKAHQFQAKKILISRPNHRLGNMLLITPLIQEVVATFPDAQIDLFVKGKLAPIVFKNYPQIGEIIELPKKTFDDFYTYLKVWASLKKKKYDLVINVEKGSSSGRYSTALPTASFKFFGDDWEHLKTKYSDYGHIAKYPVYNFRHFLELMKQKPLSQDVPLLDIRLSNEEKEQGKKVLYEIIPDKNKKTIAFFTYATGAKCYSVEWWTEFYNKFYPEFHQNYNLIEILPAENISQLERKLPTYYSKDIREMASLMNQCDLIVAADSGIMHLSSASQAPTLGLFSVTSTEMYQPYGNKNTFVHTDFENVDDIIEKMRKILL